MADPSQGGGLLGIDPSLLMNLGFGLMSTGHVGVNPGEAMAGAVGNYYNQKLASQQYQANALNMQKTKALFSIVGGLLGDPVPNGAQQRPQNAFPASPVASMGAGAPVVPSSVPSVPGAPQLFGSAPPISSGMSQGAPGQSPGAPSWLTPPSPSDLSQIQVGGMNPRALQAYGILTGKDPMLASKELRDQQLALAQQQYAPAIAKLDTLIKSDSPTRYAGADPDLKAAWSQLAPHFGFDPDKDFNDASVRTAMTFARNSLASSIGKEPIAPINQEQQISGPLGAQYARDPLTGKITQEIAPQETAQFLKNGQPVMLTKAEGMRQGLQPFSPSIFGAANFTQDAKEQAYQQYLVDGKLPTNRNPLIAGQLLDYIHKRASEEGNTSAAVSAGAASRKANGQALDQLTKLESATTSYYNTLDKNLANLQELQGKVDSSGVPLVNRVYRAWQQGVAGDPAMAKYVTYLNAVEGEYAKIQSGSLGNAPTTDAAKRDAKDVINKFMSTGQISAVADAMRGEGSNRLTSLREQVKELQERLGQKGPAASSSDSAGGDHPADVQALLNKYGH